MARADLVGLGKQTDAATKNTAPSIYVPVTSADAGADQGELTIDETVGDEFPLDSDPGGRFYRVSMEGAVRPTHMPRTLSMFLNAPTTTTPAGGTTSRSHAFDPVANRTVVYHSILIDRSDPSPAIVDLFWGAIGNTLSVSCSAPDGYMTFSAEALAPNLDDTQSAPGSPTIDTTEKFAFHKLTAYITPVGGSEAAFLINNFTINYNRNLDTDNYVLGKIDPTAILTGNVDGDITFDVRESLSTHYRRALLTTPAPQKIRILAQGTTIEGSLKYEVEFTCHRATYTSAPAPISGSDRLKGIVVSARLSKDTATSKFLSARVQNTTTAY